MTTCTTATPTMKVAHPSHRTIPPRTQADSLVDLAETRYRFVQDDSGQPFAVPLKGPNLAKPLRGSDSLRAELAREFRRAHGRVVSQAALTDAVNTLEGMALDSPRVSVALRVARTDDPLSAVIDLGTPNGRAVIADSTGWRVVERSPVLFRRSELTKAIPDPIPGGHPDLLGELLNVAPADWDLLLGWIVSALLPDVHSPILLFRGQQGTGKSTAGEMVKTLIDPSPSMRVTPPRDVDSWALQSNGARVILLDNVSQIQDWFSDALCRTVTGGALVQRRHYTNSGMVIHNCRGAVILTGIALGALRGDLRERLAAIELDPIPPDKRVDEAALLSRLEGRRPIIFGSILATLSKVLGELPTIEMKALPRMAGFARVLAAMDRAIGTRACERYLSLSESLANEIISDDPLAQSIIRFAREVGTWTGTPTDLHQRLTPDRPPQGWPRHPAVLSATLTRLAPDLARVGITVEQGRSNQARRLVITHREPSQSLVTTVTDEEPAREPPEAIQPRDDRDASQPAISGNG